MTNDIEKGWKDMHSLLEKISNSGTLKPVLRFPFVSRGREGVENETNVLRFASFCELLRRPLISEVCSIQPETPGKKPFCNRKSKNDFLVICFRTDLATRAKNTFPSQLVRAIGRKFDGSFEDPDLCTRRIIARCQEGGISVDLQAREMIENSRIWRFGHRFQTMYGMPFGPGAEEFRRDRKTALNSANEGGQGDATKCVDGGSPRCS